MPTSLVLKNNQAAITAIRAAGANQLIIAPGNGYTGGHSWLQSAEGDEPSGNYLYKISDPLNNTAIDIHEYLDTDFSGRHLVCNQSGPANLAGVTGWLKQYGLKVRRNYPVKLGELEGDCKSADKYAGHDHRVWRG
jgi:endoglucanase